jgi:hypothetical protein
MLPNLPLFVSFVFGVTTLATLLLFHRVIKNALTTEIRQKSDSVLIGMTLWLLIQAFLTLNNVYNTNTHSLPPKILLFGVLPALVLLVFLFLTKKGRAFMDSLPLKNIVFLNIVRIPVELVLFWLFLNKAVPELMTFEGRNFDILAGITAPFVAYFGVMKGKLSRRLILIWNFVCLGLLLNIVVNALLSGPSPFQQFAFDQPNVAILNFPFSWLPTFIVPVVLFGHLVSIRQLLRNKHNQTD